MFPNKKRGNDMEPKIVGRRVKKLIKKYNISIEGLAKKLEITEEELQKKLEGEEEFFVSEVIIITEIFNLDIKTVSQVFFSEETEEEKKENEKTMKL